MHTASTVKKSNAEGALDFLSFIYMRNAEKVVVPSAISCEKESFL